MQINKREKNERFVSQSLWFGAKNGLHTFVISLVDCGRQVGKCLQFTRKCAVPDQIKLKMLELSVRRGQSNFSTVYIFC